MSECAVRPSNWWEDTIQAGATFTRTITIASMDLTGWSVRGMFRRHVRDADALFDLSINSRLVITTPASGLITLSILAADTATLIGDYVFDIEVYSGPTVYRIAQGIFHVDPEVTR